MLLLKMINATVQYSRHFVDWNCIYLDASPDTLTHHISEKVLSNVHTVARAGTFVRGSWPFLPRVATAANFFGIPWQ